MLSVCAQTFTPEGRLLHAARNETINQQVQPLASGTLAGMGVQRATTGGFEYQIVEFTSLCDARLHYSNLILRNRVDTCSDDFATKP